MLSCYFVTAPCLVSGDAIHVAHFRSVLLQCRRMTISRLNKNAVESGGNLYPSRRAVFRGRLAMHLSGRNNSRTSLVVTIELLLAISLFVVGNMVVLQQLWQLRQRPS